MENGKRENEGGRPDWSRADEALQRVLAEAREQEKSVFSQETYTGEPILRTGRDFKAGWEAKPPAKPGKRPATQPAGMAQQPPARQRASRKHDPNQQNRTATLSEGSIHESGSACADDAVRASASPQPGGAIPESGSAQPEGAIRTPRYSQPSWQAAQVREGMAASRHEDLPPLLRQLRALEGPHRRSHTHREEARLFAAQARLAQDFADTAPYPGIVPYHRTASYAELSDAELRGYFTWRGHWIAGAAKRIPGTYARIRAAEVAIGVGAPIGQEGLRELERLRAASAQMDVSAMGAALRLNLDAWIRDYAIVYGLDAAPLAPAEERTFAHAVAVLRRAEELARDEGERPRPANPRPQQPPLWEGAAAAPVGTARGARPAGISATAAVGKFPAGAVPAAASSAASPAVPAAAPAVGKDSCPPDDSPGVPDAPTDRDVWHALQRISAYDTARSPFLRNHEAEAAAVAAIVFDRLVGYCALHSSTTFTSAIVGRQTSRGFVPFLGLPYAPEKPHADAHVPLTDASYAACEHGKWHLHRAYARLEQSKELGGILHAIDRQMRLDWQAGHPLKERPLPAFARNVVAEASAAVHAREAERAAAEEAARRERAAAEEAERRRIRIDFSKLGGIRADAADVREALLVDEEVDDTPAPAADWTAPAAGSNPSANWTAPAGTGMPPAKAKAPAPEPATTGPCGLTALERAALERILENAPFADLLGPGKPMESVLVDAVNEKLFDELGDAAIEYADGRPRAVPDYADDLRSLLGT